MVTNTINPRPTAALLSFNTTTCNEGPVYTLTNTLTGFGPWTVAWNDGYIQTTNGPVGSPVTLVRTVNPTNSIGVNTASNNVYFVTNVEDANTCIGNLPGDITGVVTNTINPLPTATVNLIGTTDNMTNIYSGQTVTNQFVLTGIDLGSCNGRMVQPPMFPLGMMVGYELICSDAVEFNK